MGVTAIARQQIKRKYRTHRLARGVVPHGAGFDTPP